ncbi:MAG: hypothetical protein IPM82_19385 [Saprospiraceae bacterium]|nr:hypothetical protein [Saprospiraceae bacterium]
MKQKGFHSIFRNRTKTLVLVLAGALNMQAQNLEPSPPETDKKQATALEIVGKVIDRDTKLPLEFSTISLYSKKDSLVLTGTVADADGNFSMKTIHRDFFIKVEFIAYLPATVEETELTNNQARIDLGSSN